LDNAPYPNEEHLKAFQNQKNEAQARVADLQKQLASIEIKKEEITPTAFQDKLKDVVARVITKANDVQLKLPDKFYMGFDVYQGQPPRSEAAPLLYRELLAIEKALEVPLASKNVEIKELSRNELKQEKDAKPEESDKKNPKKTDEDDGKKLVTRNKFNLKMLLPQSAFQRLMNAMVASKEQFYVVRNISIQSEQIEPSKKEIAAVVPATPTVPIDANASAVTANAGADHAKPKSEYIFGKERLDVSMEIEILDFAEPEIAATTKGKK
jgi:hypothetical protein